MAVLPWAESMVDRRAASSLAGIRPPRVERIAPASPYGNSGLRRTPISSSTVAFITDALSKPSRISWRMLVRKAKRWCGLEPITLGRPIAGS